MWSGLGLSGSRKKTGKLLESSVFHRLSLGSNLGFEFFAKASQSVAFWKLVEGR